MESKNEKDEMSLKKKLRKELILHFIIMIILFIICMWDRSVNIPKFPKNFLFLTQICLYSNMIYYFLYIYYIIKEPEAINEKQKLLLLFNFNFCVSFVVFVMYWSMIFLDKTTLYKKDNIITVPTFLNILLHGGVFIVNLFELFYDIKNKKLPYIRISFYFFFTIFYVGLLYISKILFEIKVYPFIYGNFLRFLLVSASSFIICLIGHYIYILITKRKDNINEEHGYEKFELNKAL